jgi:hypothetical protein
MKTKSIFWISIVGTLFAGYLTFSKLFTGTCALDSSCPYFLGLPACIYGLVMYLIIFTASSLLLFKEYKEELMRKVILGVSGLGILFSLFFSYQDLMCKACTFSLILPTCVYGLFMYIAVFVLAIKK